jgi:hypothetical protein
MDYESIKAIEASAYPVHMQGMQDVQSYEDLQEYCESNTVQVFQDKQWYCIVTKKEVVDLASLQPMSIKDMIQLLVQLQVWFEERKFTLDAKEDTSLKLLRYLSKKNKIKILKEESWDWNGTSMVEMTLKFL